MIQRTATARTTFLGFSGRTMVEVQEAGVLLESGTVLLEHLSSEVLDLISGGAGGDVNIPDGADITQGAKADDAWNGIDSAASVVAILKRAIIHLAAIVTSTGNTDTKSASIVTNTGNTATSAATVATNTGTINTSNTAIATSTGSIDTKTSTVVTNTGSIATGVGAIGDAAWTTGNGSLVALLKNLAGSLTSLAGTVASSRINSNIQRTGSSGSVSISSGQTESAAIDISSSITGGFVVPSVMTGNTITYKASHLNGSFIALYDQYGNQVSTPVSTSQSRAIPFPAEAAGFAYLVLVSSAAEGAARTFNTYKKG